MVFREWIYPGLNHWNCYGQQVPCTYVVFVISFLISLLKNPWVFCISVKKHTMELSIQCLRKILSIKNPHSIIMYTDTLHKRQGKEKHACNILEVACFRIRNVLTREDNVWHLIPFRINKKLLCNSSVIQLAFVITHKGFIIDLGM